MFRKRLYFDYASATPLDRDVAWHMRRYLRTGFGNPSALHSEGRRAKEVLDEARARTARSMHAKPEDIIFTSGGTESNTLSIIGHITALHASGQSYSDMHIVTSHAEHSTILHACQALERKGVAVTYLPLSREGLISVSSVMAALQPNTVMVSIQYVNSEIGTSMPVRSIAQSVHAHARKHNKTIVVHTDASQAPLFLSVQKDYLGVDLMTLDGQKMHGPRGSGVLFRNGHIRLEPVLYGGSQEFGLRPGTEPVALALGFSLALSKAQEDWKQVREKGEVVRDYGFSLLAKEIEGVVINGSRTHRVANNIHISLPGYDTTYLTVLLDREGVACSTRVSCEGRDGGVSQVVQMLHGDESISKSTLRFTFGPDTSKQDMHRLVVRLKKVIQFLDQHSFDVF